MARRAEQVKARYPTEAALCADFIEAIKAHGGWTVYPETAGFDLLCVYDKTGHQLAVEAKLKLNAKVADQILPTDWFGPGFTGPDFRAVLVPDLTEANHGIARMLRILGVMVMTPGDSWNALPFSNALGGNRRLRHHGYDADPKQQDQWGNPEPWHDWNPPARCKLPEFVPQVAAGVPSPLQLTPWKIGALRVIAELELTGFITARGVKAYGIDPRRFCASDGFLCPLGEGKWARGSLPRYEDQHPEAYAEILAKARADAAREQGVAHV